MVIHFVRLETGLRDEEVREVMAARAPEFRRVPGLVQKLYARDQGAAGAYCGVYVFDSHESLDAFRASDLAASIPAAYQARVRIERYDLLSELYPDEPLATAHAGRAAQAET
jgi:quinol monooxygenase YgiN